MRMEAAGTFLTERTVYVGSRELSNLGAAILSLSLGIVLGEKKPVTSV